jgi:prophage regulatory protein
MPTPIRSGEYPLLPESSVSAKRLLRRPEVEARVGLRVSAIYEKISRGLFPKPVKLGDRAVGWPEHEIDAWVEERLAARDRSSSQ